MLGGSFVVPVVSEDAFSSAVLLTVVTTYWPSGETCDMNPTRVLPSSLPRAALHSITSWLRMGMFGEMDASVYMPLWFWGPSRSMPSVLPSREKEWQLAQVGIPSSSSRLFGSPTLRR